VPHQQATKQCAFCGYSGISGTECPNCNANLLTQKSLLPIGHTLCNGQYRIERVLGQGGFGITYLAYDVNLHRRVAIKEFFPQHCVVRDERSLAVVVSQSKADFYQRSLARFEQEGRILAKLNHRGIVSVFCLFRELNTCYLVMEFLEGHSLATELEARNHAPISSRLTQKIIHVLTDALALTHAQGILHLDIKPDNIILTYDGRIVLLDFGAARWEREQSGDHPQSILAYTPEYAPLELIQGDELGPYTDIYELGLLAYELLTGKRPPDALKRLQRQCQWEPSADLEPPWSAMVEWATRLYPIERPQSVREWWDFGFAQKSYEATRPADDGPAEKVQKFGYKVFRYLQQLRSRYRYYVLIVFLVSLTILTVGIGWHLFAENSVAIQRQRAESALRGGRFTEALSRYNRAIQMAPGDGGLYEGRGDVRLQLQDYDGAIEDYKSALRWLGNSESLSFKVAEAWMAKGDAQQTQGDYDGAIASYEAAVAAYDKQRPLVTERIYRARLGQARNHVKADDYLKAIQVYEGLMKDEDLPSELRQQAQSQLADLLFEYGESLQRNSKHADAIKLFSLAIQQKGNDARFYAARGFSYLETNQLSLAKADLDKAIGLDDKVPEYYVIRATIKGRLQNYLSGIADYDQALRMGLETFDLYMGRGILYMQIKNYRAAVDNFNQAIVKDQASAQGYIYRGWSLYYLGQYNQAILDFNEAIRLSADNPLAYEGSGYVKFYLHDRKGSKQDLAKAKELYTRQSQLENVRKIDEFIAQKGL
jgi:serine/threonine protein kinase